MEEPLDLADLDLSRLRLSKKDLETLSNIAPGLPKCFQEQLLAKLPPTQARKLSRTLSVQTNQNCSSVKIHKRSQSSGRNVALNNKAISQEEIKEVQGTKITTPDKSTDIAKEKVPINSTGSISKMYSRCKNNGDNTKDFAPLSSSEINDKYKYYSPYVNKVIKDTSQKSNSKVLPAETTSSGAMLGRPPSGRLSPPPSADSAARRPLQRRISRLVRPDFLDMPLEEQPGDHNQISNSENSATIAGDASSNTKSSQHIRNKSVELSLGCENSNSSTHDASKYNRRSLSRTRDLDEKNKCDKKLLADKILQELQILSSMRSQELDNPENSTNSNNNSSEKTISVVKKVKKVKTKEKSTESSTDGDLKTKSVVIKKVKKIVKKSDPLAPAVGKESLESGNNKTALATDTSSPKKISKLKRPKSYPMKDSISCGNASEICGASVTRTNKSLDTTEPLATPADFGATEINSAAYIAARESRILRPKSYPTSKLIAPKETKEISSKKISTIEENVTSVVCQNPDASPMCAKSNTNLHGSSQITEPVTSDVKKVGKVTKKNKLSQLNSASTAATTIPNATSCPGGVSKESSPTSTVQPKEKVEKVEKKVNKGLLYAIGQKFEKLRASATSNSCANIPPHKKASSEKKSPEKVVNNSSEIKKTKSLSGNSNARQGHDKTSCKDKNNDGTSAQKCSTEPENGGKPIKSEKRSRIDAMIRNLRERSVPRSHPTISTESNYIKRAVSVEEMPGTFNKKSVNKVLGLFKRYEKDTNPENRVRSARSASNIEREISKQSPIYQNAHAILKLNDQLEKDNRSSGTNKESNSSTKVGKTVEEIPSPHQTCPGCLTSAEGNQEKRKGLMLELIKTEKSQPLTHNNILKSKRYPCYNNNEIYSNILPYSKSIPSSSDNGSNIISVENFSNNNVSSTIKKSGSSSNNNNHCSSLHTSQTSGYRTSSTHEINQNNNLLSPSFENIGNYSSDSRSCQEDCASTSTFLTPTEEAELCFDSWSVCSEDNCRGQRATPSPTVSHLSRASQASSPTRRGGDSSETAESVVDRIKRRSFYCRFNEKKSKRTSSIVGPNAVREYYREKSSTSRTRSSTKIAVPQTGEREHSPDITQEFFRPLKLSPIGTELKPPVYRSSFSSSHDYSATTGRPRKSLNDIRTPTSPSCLLDRRHTAFANTENGLHTITNVFPSRYKTNPYDEAPRSGAGTGASNYYSYNTYNPKRRFSFNTNSGINATGIASNVTPQIEGYATMGRRPIRSYEHRTMSLLDSPHTNTYRHEGGTPSSVRDFTASLSRSNSRYRKSSTPLSPTNI